MSLQVDDSARRSRSKSPSGRSRDRSSSRMERSPSGREKKDRVDANIVQAPYPGDDAARIVEYDDYRGNASIQRARSPSMRDGDFKYYSSASKYNDIEIRDGDSSRRDKDPRREKDLNRSYERSDRDREGEGETDRDRDSRTAVIEDRLAILPAKYAKTVDGGSHSGSAGTTRAERDKGREREQSRDHSISYGRHSRHDRPESRPPLPGRKYGFGDESDTTDDDLAYGKLPPPSRKEKTESGKDYDYRFDPRGSSQALADDRNYAGRGDDRNARIVTAEPRSPRGSFSGRDPRDPRSSRESYDPRGSHRTLDDEYSSRHSERRSDKEKKHRRGASSGNNLTVDAAGARARSRSRSRSPMPTKGIERLSISTLGAAGATLGIAAAHHHSGSISAAPGSPLQESYQGTYQSMSPMPSPLMLPRDSYAANAQIVSIEGPGFGEEVLMSPGGASGVGEKMRRRARFYDPEEDAQRLAKALKGDFHSPDTAPLIEILPGLHHEQVMELRREYKHLVKTGHDRKGVNLAKHIRARLKDEDSALMKACYATALGRWESEAYWANFWYHGDKTRRELLIESLMGRTNDEIHSIKKSFSDKKYGDSITKCMSTELKEDKFKRAVLFVLDERRMEELSRDGRPLEIDMRLVEEDCVALYDAVVSERGGETAMINVVVQRSDSHLREVLSMYSERYQSNFARDCLKKSGNLVGEMLAHILNGVINKPVRDALLVHHALTTSKRDSLRRELLISRLIRFHWDGNHMLAIKAAYRNRYGKDMQDAVRDATSNSDWGLFCRELCITRHPDDVKRVERIDNHRDDRRDDRH